MSRPVRTRCSTLAFFTLAAILAGLTPPAAAQVSELIEVRVVNVDARVSDRKGRPVTGLERDDFKVLVDGEAVEVVNFYAIDPAAAPESGTPQGPGALPLHLAILVDSSSVEARARNEALDRIRDFLRAHIGPNTQVMLASSPLEAATDRAFTARLDLVEEGFDAIAATAVQDRRSAEFQEILQDIGTSLAASNASVRGRVHTLEARIRAFSAEISRDTARTAADLRRLVSVLAGLPGRKAILYLGGGLSLHPGEALSGALAEAVARYSSLLPEGARVPDMPAPSADDDSGQLRALARDASVRGVALYAVTLGESVPTTATTLVRGSAEAGAGSPAGQEEIWAPSVGVGRQFDLESSLQLLAGATGGLATDGRDFGRLLDRLGGDARAFYSLGIQPPEGGPDQVHRLEVRVRGRGLTVRHRETFRTMNRDEVAAARTLSALWAAATGDTALDIRLEAGVPRPVGGDAYSVPISVQVPVAALAIESRGEVHAGQVSIFFAAGNGLTGGPVKKAVFPVTLPNAEILEAMGRVADYRLELEMSRGGGKIAIGVRDDLDPRLSIRTLDLVVGDADSPGS